MKLEKVIFFNRVPFNKLELKFVDNISVLSGINGSGKTTVISYLVDAFYELAKIGFVNEFEKNIGKYYRISSDINVIDEDVVSFVYFRFENEGKKVEYIDVSNCTDKEQLESVIEDDSELNFDKIYNLLEKNNGATKAWSISDQKYAESIFRANILTYFPAYRFEELAYLNDIYHIDLKFKRDSDFYGYLINPIEVTSSMDEITNWMMDIFLDSMLDNDDEKNMSLTQINEIISIILRKKTGVECSIGVGPRNYGATRLQIVDTNKHIIYPTIFGMSSGELSQMCMFLELLKQSDKIEYSCQNVSGIVLIDEIDKHLHMIMEKETLPLLLKMFPNVQFIITSHSPFFNLGLEEDFKDNYSIFNMDRNGDKCLPEETDIFRDVYQSIIAMNERFYDKYKVLLEQVKDNTVPLIITEGKTDWRHIKAAIRALDIKDFKAEFWESDEAFGDTNLISLLEKLAKINPARVMIGVVDRDNADVLDSHFDDGNNIKEFLKDKVYCIALPLKNSDEYGSSISIEHYYKKDDLLKIDKDGRRLFLGKEFFESGNSTDGKYQTKISKIQNKVAVNGIIDEKVYRSDDLEQKNSIALSKAAFANYIYEENEFSKDFDFSAFKDLILQLKDLCMKNVI